MAAWVAFSSLPQGILQEAQKVVLSCFLLLTGLLILLDKHCLRDWIDAFEVFARPDIESTVTVCGQLVAWQQAVIIKWATENIDRCELRKIEKPNKDEWPPFLLETCHRSGPCDSQAEHITLLPVSAQKVNGTQPTTPMGLPVFWGYFRMTMAKLKNCPGDPVAHKV